MLSAAATSMEPPAIDGDLDELFRRHHALVFRAAYRITGSAEDAEDVLQTVFLRLVRRRDAESIAQIESYLRRAAVNAALDILRAAHRDAEPLDESEPVDTVSSPPSPERLHRVGELGAWLRRSVARLSPRAAEIFALRFLEDRNNAEIAEILGTTEATVAVTLHRTRERLRREYRAHWGNESHVG